MRLAWENWFGGLVAAIVQATGTSGATYLGGLATGHPIDWHALAAGLAFAAVFTFMAWIATHPLPLVTTTTKTTVMQDKEGAVSLVEEVKKTEEGEKP